MGRRRKITRFLIRGTATVAIGGFLGFLAPTVVNDLFPTEQAEMDRVFVPESLIARQFIDAFTADDQQKLTELGFSSAVKLRASELRSGYARVDVPVHLGSYLAGRTTLHAYAAHAVRYDGTDEMLGWRFVSSGASFGIIWPAAEAGTP